MGLSMQTKSVAARAVLVGLMAWSAACNDGPAAGTGDGIARGLGDGSGEPSGTAGTTGGTGSTTGVPTTPTAGATGGTGAVAGQGGTSGGTSAIGGSGGTLADGGMMEPEREPPPCVTKASQVIVIGDSYINYTPDQDLNNRLAKRARDDGALSASETWRLYAVPGMSMATGGLFPTHIPDQFTQAVAADPDILFAVMDGGGNDILIPFGGPLFGGDVCKDRMDSPALPVCQDLVQAALDAAAQLMLDSADAGVRDVVYFFYPHLPGGTLGMMYPNEILDYAAPLAQELCDDAVETTEGRLRCHFLDTRAIFEGKSWIAADGIHPTAEGSEAIADAIWQIMRDECIGQPASSGCCTP